LSQLPHRDAIAAVHARGVGTCSHRTSFHSVRAAVQRAVLDPVETGS
jgi:hypothetical protein